MARVAGSTFYGQALRAIWPRPGNRAKMVTTPAPKDVEHIAEPATTHFGYVQTRRTVRRGL